MDMVDKTDAKKPSTLSTMSTVSIGVAGIQTNGRRSRLPVIPCLTRNPEGMGKRLRFIDKRSVCHYGSYRFLFYRGPALSGLCGIQDSHAGKKQNF